MLGQRRTHCINIDPTSDSRLLPANTKHSLNAVSMLAHRLRRWPNIKTALGEYPVFAGLYVWWESFGKMNGNGRQRRSTSPVWRVCCV